MEVPRKEQGLESPPDLSEGWILALGPHGRHSQSGSRVSAGKGIFTFIFLFDLAISQRY